TIRPEGTGPLDAVAGACEKLAERVADTIQDRGLPVVLGGDHSCAIGTWKGAAQALAPNGPVGLLWIDAHMDAHTPQTTPTGALHGMPLACLLGHGDPVVTALADDARIAPQHVCLIGVRSFESGEAALLKRLGVRVYFMREVVRRGLDAVMREALEIVQRGTAGFGVTIDLDALDPRDAPGVGTPVPGGLGVGELTATLTRLAHHPRLVGVEIVEYNPDRDRDAATAGLVTDILDALTAGERPLDFSSPLMELEQRHGAHHYDPLPVVLVRGEGAYLWDAQGKRYVDMMGAYSAVSHGHCHPRLTAVLAEQARTLAVTSRSYYND